MDSNDIQKLINSHKRYGFQVLRKDANFLVFTLRSGYFYNAEIIALTDSPHENLLAELNNLGYATTYRKITSPEEAERLLFHGFFSADTTRQRLIDEYKKFTNGIVSVYSKDARYSYLKSPYQINGKIGQLTPPEEVFNGIKQSGPILFLIEAAAGFGKTCAALEIVRLLTEQDDYLPLYAELSRNRQARIFRYILLDEIDRSFPLLNSNLVQSEIKNGRIATILDGFDELLRKNDESDSFENQEPMLETVSQLLTGNSKVIITTRRTVLFDGDDFHNWLERHANDFKLIRIRIQEPRLIDWLPQERITKLESIGIDMARMANPVLLSHLRCISDKEFNDVAENAEKIVDSYFTYMLKREMKRQDLRMTPESQGLILQSIAKDMMDFSYTAETREYIISHILKTQAKLIDASRALYLIEEKPSKEELANKLASHALLDRSTQDSTKIGFVNEFTLGNYSALQIIETPNWLSDDLRFIEPAVRAYAPRGEVSRQFLYESLCEAIPYLDLTSQLEIAVSLKKSIDISLSNGEVQGLSISNLNTQDNEPVGNKFIENVVFNDCTFTNCQFILSKLSQVTFLSCRFYGCSAVEENSTDNMIFTPGSLDDNGFIDQINIFSRQKITKPIDIGRQVQAHILKKFWPLGESFRQKPSRPIFKPLKFLCTPFQDHNYNEMYDYIQTLRRNGLITEMTRNQLITINLDNLIEISEFIEENSNE